MSIRVTKKANKNLLTIVFGPYLPKTVNKPDLRGVSEITRPEHRSLMRSLKYRKNVNRCN